MTNFIRKNQAVVLFFLLLAVFRFSLITRGHCFDADEHRYFYALWFWQDVLHGKFFQGFSCLFEVQGRPGFVFLSLFPAAVQIILLHLHLISTANLHFFDIPSAFNVLVSLINSFLFYRILLLVVSDQYLSLIGTAVYSLLVNSNVYLRHLLPYDYSLLFFLTAILLILKRQPGVQDMRLAFVCGLLCVIGGMVYPGYYTLALIVVVLLACRNRSYLKMPLIYLGGMLPVIIGVEIISELLRKSYLMECWILSDTVKHGSFSEGFLFIVRYLTQAEGIIGWVLLVSALVYLIGFLVKDLGACRQMLIPACLLYFIHAMMGIVFFKMVFYGRTLHMYFPFMVLAVVRLLSLIQVQYLRRAAASILLGAALVSFAAFAPAYLRLSYPGDLYFQYLSNVPSRQILKVLPGESFDPVVDRKYAAVAVNLKSYMNIKQVNEDIPQGMVLVADQPHPLNFASYTFENYGPQERVMIRQFQYRMKVYKRPYR